MSRPLPFLRSPRPQFVRGLKTAAVVVLLAALVAWLGLIPTFGAAAFLLILLVSIGVYTVLGRDRDCCETSVGPASFPNGEQAVDSPSASPPEGGAAAAPGIGQGPGKMTDLPLAMAHRNSNGGCCSARLYHSREAGFPGEVHGTGGLSPFQERPGSPHGTGCCHTAEVNNSLTVEPAKHEGTTGPSANH